MSGRKPEIEHGKARSQQLRLVPVWNKQVDQQKLARALAQLALHLVQLENTGKERKS